MIIIKIVLFIVVAKFSANACDIRKVAEGFLCVCNSTYCDRVPDIKVRNFGKYQIYYTGKSSPGFNTKIGRFSAHPKGIKNTIKINIKKRYQKILGFGGAFTDSTGINLKSLSRATQKNLLQSYFGVDGIEYTLCRVPIGGTDFSTRPYTYSDDGADPKLERFTLKEDDFQYKIPFVNEAKKLRGDKTFNLFASAWTAPIWMKTKQIYTGYSLLKEDYYQLWADYIVKFFDQYKLHNITFWGMTTGNEPFNGFTSESESKINAMGWVPLMQKKWIIENLGPSIYKSHKGLKIIVHDDARISIPYVVPLMLSDEKALNYIDGVGVHWYWDDRVPDDVLSLTKTNKKEIFLLATESCIFRQGISLGSWDRAAAYIESILEYLENDFGGWLDWNMALDITGGPTYIGYEADSPVLVNASSQEFYKQPMFYAMGHFSKFIVPDSVRLDIAHTVSTEKDKLRSIAFLRPDNLVAVIVFNNGVANSKIQIKSDSVYTESIEIAAKSLNTILFPLKGD